MTKFVLSNAVVILSVLSVQHRISAYHAMKVSRSAQLGPTVLQQILFRLFGDEEQRGFTVARQSRFDQFVAEMESQLDPEGVSI